MLNINGYDLYYTKSDYGRKIHYSHNAGNRWWSLCGLGWNKTRMVDTPVTCVTCLKKLEVFKERKR